MWGHAKIRSLLFALAAQCGCFGTTPTFSGELTKIDLPSIIQLPSPHPRDAAHYDAEVGWLPPKGSEAYRISPQALADTNAPIETYYDVLIWSSSELNGGVIAPTYKTPNGLVIVLDNLTLSVGALTAFAPEEGGVTEKQSAILDFFTKLTRAYKPPEEAYIALLLTNRREINSDPSPSTEGLEYFAFNEVSLSAGGMSPRILPDTRIILINLSRVVDDPRMVESSKISARCRPELEPLGIYSPRKCNTN